MPQYCSQTCLEPLKADQTKECRQIVTKTPKAIFKLKRNSKMGFQIHSWAQVCSLFLVSFSIVSVLFIFNMTIFSPTIYPQAQSVMPYATALQMDFTVVDVFHPYSNLLTLYYDSENKNAHKHRTMELLHIPPTFKKLPFWHKILSKKSNTTSQDNMFLIIAHSATPRQVYVSQHPHEWWILWKSLTSHSEWIP